ncbi:MAG TPA: serine--tRNA ligase [Acidocella sp.]|nr:serine--tRNA ligase [Acidocella sp.]
MHDIKAIRENPAAFDAAMSRRNILPLSTELTALDEERRQAVAQLQVLQAGRNALAKRIGEAKRAKQDTAALEAEGASLRGQMEALEAEVPRLELLLRENLAAVPNVLDEAVPDGKDETANQEIKRHGAIREFGFSPKQHFEIGEALGLMDFSAAAKLAGSRFTVLRGGLARLERALGQFMLDLHVTEHGYSETMVPLLVNDAAAFGTGQLPKFRDDLFQTTDGRWLIPTAEVSLTNLAAGEILPAAQLPIRVTALTPCFRSEAGSAGRDVRGMLRQHQFTKVELVSIVHPEASEAEHERMTACAETVLERLELPYRRMLLCTGDTGFSAAKTYDLEVWLPGQGMYREISSCSNTRAFQARRMNARYREADGKALGFVHTLNGSGVAVGRALIAVLENYQNEDGSVTIPAVLRPYMGGLERLAA